MPRALSAIAPLDADPDAADLCADGAFSVAQAARFCGLKPEGIRPYIARGEIESFKIGSRRVVPRRALVRFLAAKLTAAKEG